MPKYGFTNFYRRNRVGGWEPWVGKQVLEKKTRVYVLQKIKRSENGVLATTAILVIWRRLNLETPEKLDEYILRHTL